MTSSTGEIHYVWQSIARESYVHREGNVNAFSQMQANFVARPWNLNCFLAAVLLINKMKPFPTYSRFLKKEASCTILIMYQNVNCPWKRCQFCTVFVYLMKVYPVFLPVRTLKQHEQGSSPYFDYMRPAFAAAGHDPTKCGGTPYWTYCNPTPVFNIGHSVGVLQLAWKKPRVRLHLT